MADSAREYKKTLPIRTVGITGSVGKTTTKEMVASVLAQKYRTLKTEGNLNNDIGLPLTVLRLNESYEAAVLEMGMNHKGEISHLTSIARPDIAIITSIGVAHIENLGSQEGILKAKLEILEGLRENGCVILNGDDPLLFGCKDKLDAKTVFFGIDNPDCDVKAENIESTENGEAFDIVTAGSRFHVSIQTRGVHNIRNALAAAACALQLGISEDQIRTGLYLFKNVGMRQNIYKRNGITFIEDCYNASPDSVEAALDLLKDTTCAGKRFAVLGAMHELGDYAPEGHKRCGRRCAVCADYLLVTGPGSEDYLTGAKEAGMPEGQMHYYPEKRFIVRRLIDLLEDGDILLVKGSRAEKMEEVIEQYFEEEQGI